MSLNLLCQPQLDIKWLCMQGTIQLCVLLHFVRGHFLKVPRPLADLCVLQGDNFYFFMNHYCCLSFHYSHHNTEKSLKSCVNAYKALVSCLYWPAPLIVSSSRLYSFSAPQYRGQLLHADEAGVVWSITHQHCVERYQKYNQTINNAHIQYYKVYLVYWYMIGAESNKSKLKQDQMWFSFN